MLFAPLFVVGFEKKMIKYIFKYNIFSVVGFEKNDQGHPHRCGTSKRERIGSVQSSLLSAGIWSRLPDYSILEVTSIWVGQQVHDENYSILEVNVVFGWVCVYLLKTYRYVMKTPRLSDIGGH